MKLPACLWTWFYVTFNFHETFASLFPQTNPVWAAVFMNQQARIALSFLSFLSIFSTFLSQIWPRWGASEHSWSFGLPGLKVDAQSGSPGTTWPSHSSILRPWGVRPNSWKQPVESWMRRGGWLGVWKRWNRGVYLACWILQQLLKHLTCRHIARMWLRSFCEAEIHGMSPYVNLPPSLQLKLL